MNEKSTTPTGSPAARIVCGGGGWVPVRCRPKARFCTLMSVLSVFPSLGALAILAPGADRWFQQSTLLDGLSVVQFEEWIAFGLLVLHAGFIGFAWRFHRTEPIRDSGDLTQPNPDYDPNKLY